MSTEQDLNEAQGGGSGLNVELDVCMTAAAKWCVAFRNRTDGDGDISAADAARDELRSTILSFTASENYRLRDALENLLDVFERCESGFPPEIELRFLARDLAKAALTPNAKLRCVSRDSGEASP